MRKIDIFNRESCRNNFMQSWSLLGPFRNQQTKKAFTLSDKISSCKNFVGQNFGHQAEISTILSGEFLSDKVSDNRITQHTEFTCNDSSHSILFFLVSDGRQVSPFISTRYPSIFPAQIFSVVVGVRLHRDRWSPRWGHYIQK